MKKFIIHIALFAGVGLLILNLIGIGLDSYYSDFNNKHIDHKANWVFKKCGNHFDYTVVGSSRAYNTVDINTIDSIYNVNGINIASGGAAYSQCYVLLQKLLDKNTSDLIVLNLDHPILNSDSSFSYPFTDYAFLPIFEEEEVEEAYRKEVPYYKYLMWKYVKGSKYIEFNQKYPSYDNFMRFGRTEEYNGFEEKGGSALLYNNEKALKEITKKSYDTIATFEPNDVFYLDKILNLAKSKDIKIVFFSAPFREDLYVNRQYEIINKQIANFIQDREIDWLDYSFCDLSLDESNFTDPSHLNPKGAKLFSTKLGEDIHRLIGSSSGEKSD